MLVQEVLHFLGIDGTLGQVTRSLDSLLPHKEVLESLRTGHRSAECPCMLSGLQWTVVITDFKNAEGKELLEEQLLPAIGRVGLLEFVVLSDTQQVTGQSGQKKNTGIFDAASK